MVGAMILARVSDDPALSDEVLDQTRAWIASQGGPRPPATRSSRREPSVTEAVGSV